jgi:hypothetical protein
MHTAKLFKPENFDVEVGGESTDLRGLFPASAPHDRFGIVVTETFGGLGASLLIQAAIANFFAVYPERRKEHPAYPEIYLFHDGGPQGDHNSFDFWPPRKEVFVEGGDPVAMLGEINARAITRLAVPDTAPGDPERLTTGISTWAEQAAARERLASCFAYSAKGQVVDADIRISSADEELEMNPDYTFWPGAFIDAIEKGEGSEDNLPGLSIPIDNVRYAAQTKSRLHEVSDAVREELSAERKADRERTGGMRVETYRRIDVERTLDIIAGLGAS